MIFDTDELASRECSIHFKVPFVPHMGPSSPGPIQQRYQDGDEVKEEILAVPVFKCYFLGIQGDFLKVAYSAPGNTTMQSLIHASNVVAIHFVAEPNRIVLGIH
jgi:hypothetical protein